MSVFQTKQDQSGDNRLKSALGDVTERFIAANPESHARWKKAHDVMPGGNTRTVLHYDPFPLTMAGGDGAYLHDLDGHRFTDFLGEYSAGLYGHSNPLILKAIKDAIDDGMVLGAPNRWEAKLAAIICQRFASIDQVRFTNSGTEANLMALGAARAFTGRDKVMVFDGAYHGGVLYFAHGGSPVNVPFTFVYAPYNDSVGMLKAITGNATDLAAVLIEPMMGAGGCLPADREFLDALRNETERHGIILIFDEVMTSRSAAGGLQQRLGITPDITTLGKYLGGGASFGAFGGRADIMGQFDPTSANSIGHAGTFNNNVMSMAGGYTGLSQIFTAQAADALFKRGEDFRARLNAMISERNLAMQYTGVGSIMGLHTVGHPIRIPADTAGEMPEKATLLHLEMMMRGFVYAQRGYMTLSLAMSDQDLDNFVSAFDEVLSIHADLLA
ncbi:MAG: aminotransferase class III-fold pyridoxal phosphate-dependent enzyme [Rhodospirillaceae bacterium]|nr:aminotransferase class III-fold pyridoxal phosphate-dependent enzyme [Rhodospirillaceae bacterium]MBL6930283.1 aminotransferase class III-fold pyridoxal phosphate-dependent enzyme [Rhodospirillales bacterium]MBL6940667.1 aminotransferase class III-fold pyridoxal phosphate-dependent enzyme [Rhodospirillales bacterium]